MNQNNEPINAVKMSEFLGNEDNQKLLRSYLQAEGERLYSNVLQGLEDKYASLSVLIQQKRKGADPLARLRRIKDTFAREKTEETVKNRNSEKKKDSQKRMRDPLAELGDITFGDAFDAIADLFGKGKKVNKKDTSKSRTDTHLSRKNPLEKICDTYLVFLPTKQEVEAKTILAIKKVAVEYDQNPLRVAPSDVYAGEILQKVFSTFIAADLYFSGRLKLEEELYGELRKVELTSVKGVAEKDALALFQALPLGSHLKLMHVAITEYKQKEFEKVYRTK